MDARRKQIIDIIEREFIGPDPLANAPELVQPDGEEILSSDPPHIRYIAGILFPQKVIKAEEQSETEPEPAEPDTDGNAPVIEEHGGGRIEFAYFRNRPRG